MSTTKNHLGNIRVNYTLEKGSLVILDEQHYYPFGLEHGAYNPIRKEFRKQEEGGGNDLVVITEVANSGYQYKYNGKELQDELGLNWYDYQARNYDYAIGRFMSVDPLAQKFPYMTTYQFAGNKPSWSREIEGLESALDAMQQANAYNSLNAEGQAAWRKGEATVGIGFASLFVPGPEDVILAGFVATKVGGAILRGSTKLLSKAKKLFTKVDDKIDDVTEIIIDSSKHPESAKHLDEAIDTGKSNEGIIDRAGSKNRRKENMKDTDTKKGLDRDEAPPAVINTGEKASVNHINSSDNRGAGGSIGQQIKNLKDGEKVKIITK